ncbi:Retrovirus-related Pol polyprotein from transposon 412 [Eumeta japonica]|uniref:Retrovirus-related Pol polyprotein from transposon 412 n=1 Tax=Eumeta variegata TaxID=151549 RepID=A0A4C1ZXY1_EUMVA|nr:Retrovirus-related Pol polyprotein from transposon 412 [Eumeta japonica]
MELQLGQVLSQMMETEGTGEVALQHKFCLRQQQEGESIANYVAGLKGIGGKCNFICNNCQQSTFETHLRVQFIRGLANAEIKERLLQESSSTKFDDLIKIALAIETAKSESKEMGTERLRSTRTVFIIDRKVDPVIGREWIRKLNIQFDINSIHKEENDITEKEFKEKLHKLLEQYRELFTEEIGEINNFQATYRLKAGTSPIFLKPRPVPLALRDQVENEIDRLEKEGILEKVAYSQWGTPVVPVIKQNGKVRLCADYRATLNKNIEDDNYPIPRIEEIFSKLSGGKYFCTLDINSAYLHMPTNEETAEMQTISTCKGSYKVKRLMFGVKVAPNIWQRYMDQTLQGMEGTACFFDDIALQGSTYIQLLQRITAVFKKLTKCGLHLNKKKCQFFERSVTYLGHTINENGLHPTQEKIKDIKNSPQPTEVSSLRTFLGMINYYQQFIPNLASKLNPLYQLLKKDAVFQWSVQCEKAFQELKEEICGDKVLIPFHADLPVTLATDASPTGFGGVLSHIMPDKTERPIAFASRSLTKAEKGYSQLDKEAAALIWGLKKFFQYCYGRKITLIIDNQPLARILHPEKLHQLRRPFDLYITQIS